VPPRRPGEEFAARCGLALIVVLALVVSLLVFVNVLVSAKLGNAERVQLNLAPSPDGGGANYLMIGSDTRSFVTDPTDRQRFGEEVGGQRSDTIMVLHVDPDSERALLVSFPRDLWVDIPNRGSARLNAAFNDGPQSVIDTLASNFDVPVQHYVEVNFDSFRQIVNAIGSMNIFFPVPARDTVTGLNAPVGGCVKLDGEGALSYVRSRHLELLDPNTNEWKDADPIPDIGRIARQQGFLRALGKQMMNTALSNPFKANDIADAAISRLKLDQDFGRTDAFRLAAGFSSEDAETGPATVTVPTETATREGQEVLDATSEADPLFAQLRDFDTVVAPVSGDAKPEDVKVKVLNASGVSGAAAGALAGLEAQGFKGAGTGNARGRQTTEVRYAPGNEAGADLVANLVRGSKQKVEDDGINGADVVLVIGESFDGINEPAAAPSTQPPENAPAGQPVSLGPVPGGC
jgi:LCP family protein required for cell wall assembly